ncbi:DUF6207 family protein [Streptomyces sp. NPDC057137]|uniref:DUF6207 family protein n=1 Tax=Streptomyces sp. NPDC057137 TaxID=3346030 RepID=UPI00364154AF
MPSGPRSSSGLRLLARACRPVLAPQVWRGAEKPRQPARPTLPTMAHHHSSSKPILGRAHGLSPSKQFRRLNANANAAASPTVRVRPGMDRIDATQIPEPGLVVLDVTAHDDATAHAVMAQLERLCATLHRPYDGSLRCRESSPACMRTSGSPPGSSTTWNLRQPLRTGDRAGHARPYDCCRRGVGHSATASVRASRPGSWLPSVIGHATVPSRWSDPP